MIRSMKSITLLGSLIFLVLMVACASSSKDIRYSALSSDSSAVEGPAGSPGSPGTFGTTLREIFGDEDRSSAGIAAPQMPTAPAASAPAAPADALRAPRPEPSPNFSKPTGGASSDGAYGVSKEESEDFAQNSTGLDQQAALVSQQRIIVRTVNMALVVGEVATSVDDISALARDFGGWVVSSDRAAKHQGSISVRVPANGLDDFVLSLRGLSVEVDSESSTSQDVTDEYVDNKSRLTSLQATEQALIGLLAQARSVEDAFNVQRELAKLQADIESRQGRIKFLEETAAFSLVNVNLRLAPTEMLVDAGENQTYSLGQFARFRATFAPPEDVEEFSFSWDFGDGTPLVYGYGSAPSVEEGRRFTATVNHSYYDDKDSPYIVEIEITGTGDGGVAEGSDTFIATVTRIPTIEVFAGDNKQAEEGEEIEFVGSFTRPEGLTDIEYKWDFGDQTEPEVVTPDQGVTRATATHVYADYRPYPYTVTLTVTAQSDAGEIETVSQISAYVTESRGLVISGWSAGDTGKTAVRALSGVAQVTGSLIIWLAIFSPIWLAVGAVVVFGRRKLKARRQARAENTPVQEQA